MCHEHKKKNAIVYTQIVAWTQSRITIPSPPSTPSQSVSFLKITALNRVRYSNSGILIIFPAENKYERELYYLLSPDLFSIHSALPFTLTLFSALVEHHPQAKFVWVSVQVIFQKCFRNFQMKSCYAHKAWACSTSDI